MFLMETISMTFSLTEANKVNIIVNKNTLQPSFSG